MRTAWYRVSRPEGVEEGVHRGRSPSMRCQSSRRIKKPSMQERPSAGCQSPGEVNRLSVQGK